ncbi:glycosyltransferase family 2 protein [Chryseobacterium nematophagum]|uniref:Glycosyltransferase family 2 protein n=1 Tax=Chryseobacterium nematophagum TaxID=2305228 RepID=A0A3M7L9P8_9FLAO|nr:glycosyltransferase family 2 protein [Chryseobacterium nematophagum]RMZ59297.1 glycosyltransferase family 2 protein [Chryseobacterium nematophagum]
MIIVLKIILTLFVLIGALPLFASLYQYILIIFHAKQNHYKLTETITPRVSVVVPCWNEAEVIGNTIEHLLSIDYPLESLILYIVDDASTDNTFEIVKNKSELYPQNIRYIKREKGGQGKAHTLNAGIKVILEEDWAEAILIMDADVLFEKTTLRKLTRHLADPNVGAVMAYIKEGSTSNSLINKFIAFEYICAQAASRRAHNVLGATACVAGGAQLLTKENLIAIGGQIDTTSLAEDTFTAFKTQLAGRKAIFDPYAIVWAEEPNSLVALWKQRLRWAVGNIQVTRAFKHIWFNKQAKGLGSFSFAFIWFTILLMPLLMILVSIGLIGLFFLDSYYSWALFKQFWLLNTFTDFFIILTCLFLDPQTSKRTYLQGILFPGIISLGLIILSVHPDFMNRFLDMIVRNYNESGLHPGLNMRTILIVFLLYLWVSLCMVVSYMAYYTEKKGGPAFISRTLLLIGGYGPFLCAITLASYIRGLSQSEFKWDKTEKTGNLKVHNL